MGTAVVCTIHDLKIEMFEHLETTSHMDIDKKVNYMQRLLSVPVLKKYKTVLADFNELAKGIAGDQWTLGETKYVTMEQLWIWAKKDGIYGSGDMYLGRDICIEF